MTSYSSRGATLQMQIPKYFHLWGSFSRILGSRDLISGPLSTL